ncbi:MAG: DUF4912 domain-containing protein [Nitrospinae bacterium]|nr:DUF4912 domain-containing protein [Nitrospinota bacterium]MBF0633571.1 DUF4912 domain-containing protein [Nitrospinota bacterium]
MAGELKELTKAELIKKATKLKIVVAASMSKDEIVSTLKKAAPKPAQAPAKTASKKAAASSKPVAVKKAAVASKPAVAKKPVAAAKPVAAPAKLVSVKKPVATAKPVAAKKDIAAKSAAVKKPAAPKPAAVPAKVALKPATKAVETTVAETTAVKSPAAVISVKSKAEPVAAVVETKKPKEEKTTTRKSTAADSKAVDAGEQDKTGKRLARSRIPASPTTPLNAGKEPSLAPAVSTLSLNTAALKNGKRSWDIKIDEKKFFIADEKYDYTQHGDQPRLPERYGDMRLIAMARDPLKLYIYWELDGGGVERAREKIGCDWPSLRWVMRVFDVTGVEFNGGNANSFFDVEINPYLGSVYMDVDKSDCEYTIVMGLRDNSGRFEPVVASNKVRTPRVEPSSRTDAEWSVPEGLFAAIYGISGGYTSTAAGSLDSSRLSMPFEDTSSGAVSSFGGVSSFAVSSFNVSSFGSSEQMARLKQRKFFFWLDCELIVYGGTEPDATVHMMGKKLTLRPDGTFSARFSLPDGLYDIPVTAQSSDGVELREISPTVTRTTRRKEEFLISEDEWRKK